MSVGKRRSTDEPLTEHDVAERLDKAAVRLYRILTEVREMDMLEAVQHSRYYHGEMLAALAAELADGWRIVPQPLRLSMEPGTEVASRPVPTGQEAEHG